MPFDPAQHDLPTHNPFVALLCARETVVRTCVDNRKMGVVKKRKHSTSPNVEPSQEDSKKFEDRCRDNLKIANLNWLICSNCLSLIFYVCHIGWNVNWLIFKQEKDWWYLGFWLTSAVIVTVRSFLFYNDNKTCGPRDRLPEESHVARWSKWVLGLVCPIPR